MGDKLRRALTKTEARGARHIIGRHTRHRNEHDEAPLLDGAVFPCSTGNGLMTQKFDPAPKDKHAVDPKDAIGADKSKTNLKEGLEESFPGSDPASATQPKKSKDA
jgi:hypothetical protein